MQIRIDGTTVTYTHDDVPHVLRHRTEEQAHCAAMAIRECAANPRMTVGGLVGLWIRAHAKPTLSGNSRASYASTINRHLLPHLDDVPVVDLGVDEIRTLIETLAAEEGCYRKVTPTVQRLQALLNKALKWGLIDDNPVMRIDALFLCGRPAGLRAVA
jgi:hypothetical protein